MSLDTAEVRIQDICNQSGGRSELFAKGTEGYFASIRHFYTSSSQFAKFAVQPGSAKDLSDIMEVVKDFNNDAFAIKGGGHNSNPTFSSTTDIHISLLRFKKISFDQHKLELTVGAGYTAAEIYKFINPQGYTIVGGENDVGISGWMTGGGYSRITSQYGLGIDNLVQAEVVLPHGGIKIASEEENPDLFWAIKGGGNNFGIVTEFVLKAYKHGKVYGGLLHFKEAQLEKVKTAILKFTGQQDHKANIESAIRYHSVGDASKDSLQFECLLVAYYDGPKPNPDPFRDFLAIPHTGELTETSSSAKLDTAASLLHSYLSAEDAIAFYNKIPADGVPLPPIPPILIPEAIRARWGNVMVSGKYTMELINAIETEVNVAKELMGKHGGKRVNGDVWPFLPTKGSDAAWPHKVHNEFILVYFLWEGEKNDHIWISQLKGALDRIRKVAIEQGCATPDAPVYYNTSIAEYTSPLQVYRKHLADLSLLRGIYDPYDVMRRTGGYRIPTGLTGIITNVKGNATIGVATLPGAVKTGDIDKKIFQISPASDKPGEYIISIKDGSAIYSAVDNGGDIYCKAVERSTWRLVPTTRNLNNDQFEYFIRDGPKHWVLRDGQVKIGTVTSAEALWRFNLVDGIQKDL